MAVIYREVPSMERICITDANEAYRYISNLGFSDCDIDILSDLLAADKLWEKTQEYESVCNVVERLVHLADVLCLAAVKTPDGLLYTVLYDALEDLQAEVALIKKDLRFDVR